MPKPKVLLADDHTIVLDGLRSLLEDEFELVGSVEDGRALVAAATANVPDVIVVDISMPLLNGIEAVRQLRAAGNEAKVIFLTMHGDVTFVREALRARGSGYLLKRSAAKELVTAIQQVLRGKIYVTPLVTDDLPDMLPGPIRDVEQIGTNLRTGRRRSCSLSRKATRSKRSPAF